MKKIIMTFEEFVLNEANKLNESANIKKLKKFLGDIFRELKKSKNFQVVKWEVPDDKDFLNGKIIYIKSNLKSENEHHKNEYDEFEIGVSDENDIVAHYILNGDTQTIKVMKDVIKYTRAEE